MLGRGHFSEFFSVVRNICVILVVSECVIRHFHIFRKKTSVLKKKLSDFAQFCFAFCRRKTKRALFLFSKHIKVILGFSSESRVMWAWETRTSPEKLADIWTTTVRGFRSCFELCGHYCSFCRISMRLELKLRTETADSLHSFTQKQATA